MDISSVCRSVCLVAKAIDLDLEFVEVNLFAGDHKSPEFLRMNPQHTIPTLDDNGNFLWDSHAIIPYLVQTYGRNDDLYPQDDIFKRARIDQRLHFDNGILYAQLRKAVVSVQTGTFKLSKV